MVAPLDVVLADDTVMQRDVLVIAQAGGGESASLRLPFPVMVNPADLVR